MVLQVPWPETHPVLSIQKSCYIASFSGLLTTLCLIACSIQNRIVGSSHCHKWFMARTPTSSGVVSTIAGVVSLVSCSLVSSTKPQETLVSVEDNCCRGERQLQDCHCTITQYSIHSARETIVTMI